SFVGCKNCVEAVTDSDGWVDNDRSPVTPEAQINHPRPKPVPARIVLQHALALVCHLIAFELLNFRVRASIDGVNVLRENPREATIEVRAPIFRGLPKPKIVFGS